MTLDAKRRQQVTTAVRKAVKDGRLVKTACIDCGSKRGVVAHHPRGYDDEHVLDVEWLCNTCHGDRHRLPASAPLGAGPRLGDREGGARLKELRELLKATQGEVAARMHITQPRVVQIERSAVVSRSTSHRYQAALQIIMFQRQLDD